MQDAIEAVRKSAGGRPQDVGILVNLIDTVGRETARGRLRMTYGQALDATGRRAMRYALPELERVGRAAGFKVEADVKRRLVWFDWPDFQVGG